MERGVYFDGWYRNNYCYHPSLPPRSMQMVEDLERLHGTLLVWSAMGGGSISLPWLEHEAFGPVDPRLRFYGFLNDSEFAAECSRRGIKCFGIVFESQGWQFPAKYSADQSRFEEINVARSDGADWYGLQEFSSDRHWQVFGKRFAHYFPHGLVTTDGVEVADLWTQCATKDVDGKPCHTRWVEVKGHGHQCYLMCRNNPAWRQYMKKIMEIQIDAGVAGIQLDEPESPMISVDYGGCFCPSCMKGFNAYLKRLGEARRLPEELAGVDLDTFHYGGYLKSRGVSYPGTRRDVPLFQQYWHFQLGSLKECFHELSAHAKAYGKTKGREILVSGNFYNLHLANLANEPAVDVVITEMRQTLFKQSYWYRYAAGFAGEKPIIVAENPYGGIIPKLAEMLEAGRGFDLYRIFLLEAAAYGCNMSIPYYAWMGTELKCSFSPPRAVSEEIQGFLADKEGLFARYSGANVLLLYSFSSYWWREATDAYSQDTQADDPQDLLSYNVAGMVDPKGPRMPFWEIAKRLSDNQVIYDVKILADGDIKPDTFSPAALAGYDLVVLADCTSLTENQARVLSTYAGAMGKLLVFGRAAENVEGWLARLSAAPGAVVCPDAKRKTSALEAFEAAFNPLYRDLWKVKTSAKSVGIHTHSLGDRMAIHLLNYNYSRETDAVKPVKKLTITIRGLKKKPRVVTHSPGAKRLKCDVEYKDGSARLTLHDLPLYAILELATRAG